MSESNYTNYMNTYVEFLLNQDKEPETQEVEATCSHNHEPPKKKGNMLQEQYVYIHLQFTKSVVLI